MRRDYVFVQKKDHGHFFPNIYIVGKIYSHTMKKLFSGWCSMTERTLYLWDLANTLFREVWNKKLTGFDSFEDYVISRGVKINDARGFEECYREPYLQGEMFNLDIMPGYREVLNWTKNNETFSTGFQEQLRWRAFYLNPRVGFDILQYFRRMGSTFDYGETNVKTPEMLEKYLVRKKGEGYDVIVYTDDKLKNCKMFKTAAEKVGVGFRVYHILNDDSGLRDKRRYWEIGNLYDLKENEERIRK